MTRLLLYCHNVTGLGHIARSSTIAAAATGDGREVTLLTGCPFLSAMTIAPQVRVVTLPPVRFGRRFGFEAIDVTGATDAGADIMQVRQARIVEVLREIRPHAVLVDHHPLGLAGELVPALLAAQAERWATRFVWGIPYFSGGPIGRPRPANPRFQRATAQYASAIGLCDPTEWSELEALNSWAVPARRAYVGLVSDLPREPLPTEPGLVVVLCGGGTSAPALIEQVLAAKALMHADRQLPAPRPVRFRVVAGPMADPATLTSLIARDADVEWIGRANAADAVRDAQVVVARCGYNTAGLLTRTDRPLIFVPAVGSSGDQLIRAERLAQMPGVWSLTAESTGADLATTLDAALASPPIARDAAWQLDGARGAADWLAAEGDAARAEMGEAR